MPQDDQNTQSKSARMRRLREWKLSRKTKRNKGNSYQPPVTTLSSSSPQQPPPSKLFSLKFKSSLKSTKPRALSNSNSNSNSNSIPGDSNSTEKTETHPPPQLNQSRSISLSENNIPLDGTTPDIEDGITKSEVYDDTEDFISLHVETDEYSTSSLPFGNSSSDSKRVQIPVVDHKNINYEPFRKQFYVPPKELLELTPDQVKRKRIKLDKIRIRGDVSGVPAPIENWAHAALPENILKIIQDNQYLYPSPIQAQAIPIILSGMDILACARTGSGKTLAFLLPMFRHLISRDSVASPTNGGIYAAILAPTRELSTQIYSEALQFTKVLGFRMICAYGGSPLREQINAVKAGVHIVVATPGRFIDLLRLNSGRMTDISQCTYVVLDEADRMLDMGFAPQIRAILSNIRPDRQICCFSATFPRGIVQLALEFLNNPVQLTIGGGAHTVCKDVEHHVLVLSDRRAKFQKLLHILGQHQQNQSLVFVHTKKDADELFDKLRQRGYYCLPIHAGSDQSDRDSILIDFKNGIIQVLIATSVVARGLDIPAISVVVNYDCPDHLEDYIHRVGRTGRAGRPGTAYTFVTQSEDRYANFLIQALKNSKSKIPKELQQLAQIYEAKIKSGLIRQHTSSGFGGRGFRFDQESLEQRKAQRTLKALEMGVVVDEHKALKATEVIEGSKIKKVDSSTGDKTKSLVPPLEPVNLTQSEEEEESKSAAKTKTKTKIESVSTKSEAEASPPDTAKMANKMALDAAIKRAQSIAASKTKSILEQQKKQDHNRKKQQDSQEALANLRPDPFFTDVTDEMPSSEAEKFCTEININNVPPEVRRTLTRKDALLEFALESRTIIKVRGIFVEPGSNPPPGHKKIHIYIEGNSRNSVAAAKHEITTKIIKLIRELGGGRGKGKGKDNYAKFSVFDS